MCTPGTLRQRQQECLKDSTVKRVFDFSTALLGLLVLSPLLLLVMLAIWLQDFGSPFYKAPRIAQGGGTFGFVKFRSMVVYADKSGINSTASDDRRITRPGQILRSYKLDELPQLWNVLKGEMSLVGPRPQIPVEADRYTDAEKRILTAPPGITDLASIVFADEGDILKGNSDPDLLYNQIIRPWKSRLALLYVDHQTFWIDIWILVVTLAGIFSRKAALSGIRPILRRWGADPLLVRMAGREEPLLPYPPPGATDVVA